MYCIKWRVLWRWLKFKHVRINTQFLINKFWGGPPCMYACVYVCVHILYIYIYSLQYMWNFWVTQLTMLLFEELPVFQSSWAILNSYQQYIRALVSWKLVTVCLFNILVGIKLNLIVALIWLSLAKMLHIFHVHIGHWYVFCKDVSIQIFCPF